MENTERDRLKAMLRNEGIEYVRSRIEHKSLESLMREADGNLERARKKDDDLLMSFYLGVEMEVLAIETRTRTVPMLDITKRR